MGPVNVFSEGILSSSWINAAETVAKAAPVVACTAGFIAVSSINDMAYAIQDVISPGLASAMLSSTMLTVAVEVNAKCAIPLAGLQTLYSVGSGVMRQDEFIEAQRVMGAAWLGLGVGTIIARVGKKVADVASAKLITPIIGTAITCVQGIIIHLDVQQAGACSFRRTGILPHMLLPGLVALGSTFDYSRYLQNKG